MPETNLHLTLETLQSLVVQSPGAASKIATACLLAWQDIANDPDRSIELCFRALDIGGVGADEVMIKSYFDAAAPSDRIDIFLRVALLKLSGDSMAHILDHVDKNPQSLKSRRALVLALRLALPRIETLSAFRGLISAAASDADEELRVNGLRLLESVGELMDSEITVLLGAFDDKSDDVRLGALCTILRIFELDRPGADRLFNVMIDDNVIDQLNHISAHDPNASVRRNATVALHNLAEWQARRNG